MKRAYICHPYANDPDGNKAKVDKICKDVLKQGVLPISPIHAFGYMQDDAHRQDVMQACLRLMEICDEVWVYGDSEGCQIERYTAVQKGIKVVDKRGKEKTALSASTDNGGKVGNTHLNYMPKGGCRQDGCI